ncbi:hypothetical protein RhiirA5_397225 [Rhizophagus irregularis]|uniref:Uncharacterized protein n=1 Tax=Rhizophagus irregularis TaxID=588596 RepID=A0A2N0PYG2_9GLOM|nr:hypothetical protein RhiirA5_397225 [Rhizophagus irregularis]
MITNWSPVIFIFSLFYCPERSVDVVSIMIENSGGHLREILLEYDYLFEEDNFNEDSLILIRKIHEHCPLVERLSLAFSPSEQHFTEFEKLLKVCRKLKSLLIIPYFKEFKKNYEYGEELLKIIIRSSSTNLREIRFFEQFILTLKTLEEFFENWRDYLGQLNNLTNKKFWKNPKEGRRIYGNMLEHVTIINPITKSEEIKMSYMEGLEEENFKINKVEDDKDDENGKDDKDDDYGDDKDDNKDMEDIYLENIEDTYETIDYDESDCVGFFSEIYNQIKECEKIRENKLKDKNELKNIKATTYSQETYSSSLIPENESSQYRLISDNYSDCEID